MWAGGTTTPSPRGALIGAAKQSINSWEEGRKSPFFPVSIFQN